jgi:hypothetical protein
MVVMTVMIMMEEMKTGLAAQTTSSFYPFGVLANLNK